MLVVLVYVVELQAAKRVVHGLALRRGRLGRGYRKVLGGDAEEVSVDGRWEGSEGEAVKVEFSWGSLARGE